YMGSGKSAVGKVLSTILNYSFVDLDTEIERSEKQPLQQLFATKGEIYFRKKEANVLHGLLLTKENQVIALGGGTPCYGTVLHDLKNRGGVTTIYLKLGIPQLTDRLLKEKNIRPLISHIKTRQTMAQFIGKHLFERAPFYEQADAVFAVKDETVAETARQIARRLF
ncbi:MAG: shikimate kinase, partial [Marinirhabdus sp.]